MGHEFFTDDFGLERSFLDEVVVEIPLMEPAGQALDLTARSLCEHTLIVGNTGSGKTTLMNHFLQQSIAFRAADEHLKCGLFICDFKADDTVGRVEGWAAQCGRGDDVIVLRSGSRFAYDPFAQAGSLVDAEKAAYKLGIGTDFGGDNVYWSQTRDAILRSALTTCLVAHGRLDFHRTMQFLSRLLLLPMAARSGEAQAVVEVAAAIDCASAELEPGVANRLEFASKMLLIYLKLDPRTQGILRSCLACCLEPLLEYEAAAIFSQDGREVVNIAEALTGGKIIVLSINAMDQPALAATLGRLVKSDVFGAIQKRVCDPDGDDRLVGVFLDEYPLVATADEPFYGDVQNLQTLRARRGFVVAAAQGYVSLECRLGRAGWESLRINFASSFFLRSIEERVEHHARLILGKTERQSDKHPDMEPVRADSWVIPPGGLARLDPFQCYVSLSDGLRISCPVSFEPLHGAKGMGTTHNPPDNLGPVLNQVRRFLPSVLVASESIIESDTKESEVPFLVPEVRCEESNEKIVELPNFNEILETADFTPPDSSPDSPEWPHNRPTFGLLDLVRFLKSPEGLTLREQAASEVLPELARRMVVLLKEAGGFLPRRNWPSVRDALSDEPGTQPIRWDVLADHFDLHHVDGLMFLPDPCAAGLFALLRDEPGEGIDFKTLPPLETLSYYEGIPIVIFQAEEINQCNFSRTWQATVRLVDAFRYSIYANGQICYDRSVNARRGSQNQPPR